MESKLLKFVVLILFGLVCGFLNSAEAAEKTFGPAESAAMLKKYGSYRPKETLEWKPSKSPDLIVLKNEYFGISYPKCFHVEPTVRDGDDVNIQNSASLDLVRTESCKEFNKADSLNMLRFYDAWNIGSGDPTKFEELEAASKAVYRQVLKVGDLNGVIYAIVGAGYVSRPGPYLGFTVYLGCKEKETKLYSAQFSTADADGVEKALKEKNFAVPEDFKSIVSSFKCPTKKSGK